MAVERNEAVLKLVEDRLREDPDQTTKDLKRAAEEIDDDIKELTPREFNARYPLQVKRKMAAEEKASGDGGPPAGESAEKESGASGEVDEATRDRVYRMIEEALRKDADISNRILQERAAEIDSSIGDLSARSFNARYPLQVKRRLAAERRKRKRKRSSRMPGPGATSCGPPSVARCSTSRRTWREPRIAAR